MEKINSTIIIGLLCLGFSFMAKAQEVIETQEGTIPEIIPQESTQPENVPTPSPELEEVEKIELVGQVVEALPPPPDPLPVAELDEKNKTLPPQKKITYTWADFTSGKHCSSADTFATENKEISNLIFSYCNYPKGDAWQKWLNTFRTTKKDFLVQQDMKEQNKFIRYLKAIPHLLFEVHDTQNNTNDLTGQLNQIESAILKRETTQAIELIQSVQNDSLKLALQPVLNEGKNLLKIQKELEPTMEANND